MHSVANGYVVDDDRAVQDACAGQQATGHLLACTHGSFRPLKVLFVTSMYPEEANPASGTFVRQQAEYLRKAGHQVDVLNIGRRRSRLKYLISLADVFARTRATPYDIVHAHYGLSGFPALFRYKTPLVITLHGSDVLIGRIQPLISRVVCSLADAVIVVSKKIQTLIAGEVIPCGVDMEVFKPLGCTEARARLGLPLDRKIVLFPFDPARKLKRYELARAAVDKLRGRAIQLLTVDCQPNEEMPWYYSAADVMILSSESEGSPTSVKEALACNLPVVSTDVGDVREILQGVEGCEICEANAESLAQGLKRVLDRSESIPFSGRALLRRYDQTQVVAAIVGVYERTFRAYSVGRHSAEGNGRNPIRTRLLDGRFSRRHIVPPSTFDTGPKPYLDCLCSASQGLFDTRTIHGLAAKQVRKEFPDLHR